MRILGDWRNEAAVCTADGTAPTIGVSIRSGVQASSGSGEGGVAPNFNRAANTRVRFFVATIELAC